MKNNNFVKEYLGRIKYEGEVCINLNTLSMIQKQHLLNVPFENLDIHNDIKIKLDILNLWNKIVLNKRGGICYELNGLLLQLLKEIGFKARYISANISEQGSKYDHMLLLVDLDNEFLDNLSEKFGIKLSCNI